MRTLLLAVALLTACDDIEPSTDTGPASGDSGSNNPGDTHNGGDNGDNGNGNGNGDGNGGDADDTDTDDTKTEPDLKAGYVLFVGDCAECHGEDGYSGDAPDLQGRISRFNDADLMTLILEGSGEMPGRELTGQEKVDLLAYLRMAFP
ncbi:MAG: cytochrome c [Myxococcota bacterium]